MNIYNKLFDFEIKNNLRISITNNEIYIQSLLFLFEKTQGDLLILTPALSEATKLFNRIRKYINNTFLFPEDEYITKKALAVSPEFLYMRLELLNNIRNNGKKIVISHLNSYLKYLPDPLSFSNKKLNIKVEDTYNRDTFVNNLIDLGYKKETVVTNTGEFSVRGYVVDVFPLGEEHPVRIEFFDDLVEKIKIFDEFSQLTLKVLNKISINPIKDVFSKSDSTIINYLDKPLLVVQDKSTLDNVYDSLVDQMKYYDDKSDEYSTLSFDRNVCTIYFDLINNFGKYDYVYNSVQTKDYKSDIDLFIEDIKILSDTHKINVFTTNQKLIKKLKTHLDKPLNISYYNFELNKGFIYQNEYFFTTNDIFDSKTNYDYKVNYKIGKRINNLNNLKIGDYVVHKFNGIGIYQGIKTLEKAGIKKDYIYIQYKGEDKLYLPVEDVDKIYKYSSKEGASPKINKLNSLEWKKTKAKIISRVNDIREKLIEIYREREKIKVIPFEKDYPEQLLFENEFSYTATTDQIKAINEIKKDLESSKPMDRLLCGDVGYGKTEVIFRAMFKSVMNSKQVAYLCPTTILSYQQFESAKERFKNYAINIALLNRYTSVKETKKIIEDLKLGKIDIVFGTHRLLSKDIEFKELGLLVIDEEHRFGVTHKEKIKEMKANVHVLSVSATPIPRTLQMSLVGIRDLSLIETAPSNRLPVQTYVINYDELLIKEVISKEISRNGQVFILYNKIENMESLKDKYSKLLPDINIRYAHGKMNKDEIQDIMYKFMNREFDVLIATTIIENGIDVPNANTIIVIDADHFGLSQLYQIRGRVGRSDRMAYAYLMYDKRRVLTETAVKRLEAIKEFTELGSGYKISMRDLTIRGAGDILGSEQAGFIDSVGVDMYLELINSTDDEDDSQENKVVLDEVSTHIDQKYTDEDEIIIEMHKKINAIKSYADLKTVEEEINDRFGFVGEDLKLYMYQELLESLLENEKISIFINNRLKITLKLDFDLVKKLDMEKLFVFTTRLNGKFNFEYKNDNLFISLNKVNLEKEYQLYLIELLNYIRDNKKENN